MCALGQRYVVAADIFLRLRKFPATGTKQYAGTK